MHLKLRIFFVCVYVTAVASQQTAFKAKLCVIQENLTPCLSLIGGSSSTPFECVAARDRIECLHKVGNGEADIVTVPSNEAYSATRDFTNLIPLLEEQRTEGEFIYESVAVVRNTTNIKSLNEIRGKKSCHTGYKRTAGWDIPIAFLTAEKILPCSNDDELADVSTFFSQSCVPGNWSTNANQTKLLKTRYKNLCELCDQPCNSSASSKYAGYEGALKCLVEKSADIAFTKHSTVLDFLKENTSFANNYRLLCPNGTLVNLTQTCFWGARANPLIITRNNISAANRTDLQTKLLGFLEQKPRADGVEGTILMNKTSFAVRNISGSIKDHLVKANFLITMDKPLPDPCREKYARLCVNTDLEIAKCKDLKMGAFANRLRPTVECVQRPDCNKKINKDADFTVAGLEATYEGLKINKLVSLMTESFSLNGPKYYLVGVIKSNSTIKTLSNLKGSKSCHSNFKCEISWRVPKGVLASKKQLKGPACKLDKQMSEFFSSSCAPGAPKDLPNLCSLCKGDSQNKSKCSDTDEYGGFRGGFRCLVEGGGDIAFVPHTIFPLLLDNPKTDQPWAKNLKSTDFKLLCLTDEVKPITDYASCNWGAIPGNQLLVSSNADRLRESMLQLLITAGSSFGPQSPTFKLYSTYENKTDVIFSNGTIGLAMQEKTTPNDILGQSVYNVMELTYCKDAASTIQINGLILILASLSILRYILW